MASLMGALRQQGDRAQRMIAELRNTAPWDTLTPSQAWALVHAHEDGEADAPKARAAAVQRLVQLYSPLLDHSSMRRLDQLVDDVVDHLLNWTEVVSNYELDKVTRLSTEARIAYPDGTSRSLGDLLRAADPGVVLNDSVEMSTWELMRLTADGDYLTSGNRRLLIQVVTISKRGVARPSPTSVTPWRCRRPLPSRRRMATANRSTTKRPPLLGGSGSTLSARRSYLPTLRSCRPYN